MTWPDPMGDYLQRLDEAAGALPEAERRELRAEIEQHLRDALADDDGEASLREALERLGDPHEIVAEQLRSQTPPQPRRRVGAQQWGAIFLLLAGGFLAGIGWIVGLVLLWSSKAWSVREKLIGTLLVPGGLATVFYVALWAGAGGETCTGGGAVRVNGTTRGGLHVSGGTLRALERCTGATTVADRVLALLLLVFLLVAPVVTAVFLAVRARPLAV